MRESRTKVPNKEGMESKARSEGERIERLSNALRSVAEIVDAALREDHRSNYLAKQLAEQLAQVKVEPGSDTRTERKVERKNEPRTDGARVSTRNGESRSDAVGLGAKVIVTPYVSSEMSQSTEQLEGGLLAKNSVPEGRQTSRVDAKART